MLQKNAQINIPHFRFILLNSNFFGESVTPPSETNTSLRLSSRFLLLYIWVSITELIGKWALGILQQGKVCTVKMCDS